MEQLKMRAFISYYFRLLSRKILLFVICELITIGLDEYENFFIRE